LVEDGQKLKDPLARIWSWRGLSVQPARDGARVRVKHPRQITLVKLHLLACLTEPAS
jgi:hypothetical protein